MEIIYKPAADVTLGDFADKYGLSLLIEGLVASDDKYSASLVRGDDIAISVHGFGNTESEAVADLVKRISNQTVLCIDTIMRVPRLVTGDLVIDIKKAVADYNVKVIEPVKGI